MTKTICLAILFLGLCACASAPLVVEGRYLQNGPADAVLHEIPLETKGTCEMLLRELSYSARKNGRCAASSADLAYGFDAKLAIIGATVMSARTFKLCESGRANLIKTKPADSEVLSDCRKL